MKRFFKIKRKKSPKPFRQPFLPEKPADIAAGPPNLRAEPNVTIPSDGGRNVSDNNLAADYTDPTVPPNEGGSIDPQALFQDEMDVGEELPASGASTSVVAIGGADYGDQLTTEGSNDTEGETGPTETSTVAKKIHEDTLLRGTKSNTQKFGPLKVVLEKIRALFADRTESVAVGNRITILLSSVVALEDCFNSLARGVAEQRRQMDLIPKLNAIGEQLRPLCEERELLRPTDHVQVGEDVFRLLEDLREAILSHRMAQQMATDGHGFRQIDPAEAAILNNVQCAKQAEYLHGNRNGCLRGTRAAILDKIELWTRDFDKPPVYWLNGLAGTGKSTIAQTIAERTFADGRLGASFFCSRDFEDRRNLQSIFPTLAVQLARRYSQFRSILIQLVQSNPEIIHESLYNQMKKLIIQPLAESAVSTVIVIDALDECKDKQPVSAILSVLGQFVVEVPAVKFFITGRPESRIQEGFRLTSLVDSTDVFVLHEVKPGQVENDIRLFFTHSFSELKRYRRGLGDWPTEGQVDVLCSRAGGLFVHAVAAVRFIDHRSTSPKKQLDRLLQSQESGAFEGKTEFKDNETLDSLYTSILREAFGGDDPENDLRVRSIFGAVVLAANPLSPSAIATLLGLEPEEVYPVLSLVQSLLILQEDPDQPVRPFHKSFPDFVVDPARCTNQRFLVRPPVQHVELLGGCLGTMNRELERNMCKLPDGVINSEVLDLKERTEEHIGQALKYACKSWHKHLVDTIPVDVTPVLHEFMKKKLLFWLEVLSVLGAAREAVDALEATMRCEWPDGSPTLNLIRDYIRFVIAFFEIINTSAPHIYHSALLLSPRTSITHELYKNHASPLVRVVQGIPDSWERVVATAHFDSTLIDAVWSPCNRFIAVAKWQSVEVLDAVTLNQLSIFENSLYATLDLQQLSFSPDCCCLTLCVDRALISWDIQTGSPLGTIHLRPERSDDKPFSFKHSQDGKVIAAAYKPRAHYYGDDGYSSLTCAYDHHSGRHLGSHCFLEARIIHPMWTHNEYLQFATIDPKSIRIWQSPFTLEHPPVEVASFPVPDGITDANRLLFHPSLSRLAFVLGDTIQVWDLKVSKLLLKSKLTPSPDERFPPQSSFSSDGHFFAYTTRTDGFHVWKESPTGYLYYQWLPFFPYQSHVAPQLSPNTESIIVSLKSKIHRLHTRDQAQVASLPSVSTGDSRPSDFTLGFSPDENFAAFARRRGNTVTIIDLKSGEQKWSANMGLEIGCVGMAGGTGIVVGRDSIVIWNLPGGDRTFNASINDIVRTTIFDPSPSRNLGMPSHMSISPDLSRIVITRGSSGTLEVDDVTSGSCLARIHTGGTLRPHFTQDGREVWGMNYHSFGKQCEIIEDRKSGAIELKLRTTEGPSMEFFRESSRGYVVTDGWWVLSPSQKRLLWLPHRWRSREWNRVWGGRFLGLLDGDLSEVVVLEFLE